MTPRLALNTLNFRNVIRQLAEDLVRLAKDSSSLRPDDSLMVDLETILAPSSQNLLLVDVAVSSIVSEMVAKRLAAAIGFGLTPEVIIKELNNTLPGVIRLPLAGGTICFSFWKIATPPIYSTISLRAPLLLCDLSEIAQFTPEALADLDVICDQRALVVALSDGLSGTASIPSSFQRATRFGVLTSPQSSLESYLSQQQPIPVADCLHAFALAQSVQALLNIFSYSLEREHCRIGTTVLQIQQKLRQLQNYSRLSADIILSNIKNSIQKLSIAFERECEERIEKLLDDLPGNIWSEIENWISAVEKLEENKRGSTIVFRTPEAVNDHLILQLRARLSEHAIRDLSELQLLRSRIDTMLAARLADGEIEPFSVPLSSDLNLKRKIDRLLNTVILFQQGYEAEVHRPGFMVILQKVRTPWMVVMMVLAPFGVLPVLREYKEIFIPSAIALLLTGILISINSFKRERLESRTQRLQDAHKAIRSEFSRMIAGFQMKWIACIRQHLSDEAQRIINELESPIRNQSQIASIKQAEERQKLQVDLHHRQSVTQSLIAFIKTKDTIAKKLKETQSELEQAIPSFVGGSL